MDEPKTTRQFEQRFLDRPDRLREVTRGRGKGRMNSLRKRYATMVLGGALAVGSFGIPIAKMGKSTSTGEKPQPAKTASSTTGDDTGSGSVMKELTEDLKSAQSIAREVTGGVEQAAQTVAAPIRAVEQEVTKDVTLIASTATDEFFKKEVPYGSIILAEAKKNNLKPELVAAVVKAESRFKPNARSPVGAQGLMQLVPKTGKWMGAKNLMDPVQNIKAGTKYLKYLNERFDHNETKVIAAYNAGEGNVRRFGGIPPFKETRNYVKKVRSYTADFAQQANAFASEASSGATAMGGTSVVR